MRSAEIVAGLLLAFAPLQAVAAEPPVARAAITVAGVERSYFYYVSSKSNSFNAQPLVFVLHPAGEYAAQYAARSGWIALAEARGFAVVFPQAGPEGWRGDGSDSAYLKAVFDQAGTNLPSRFAGDGTAGRPNMIWAWETLRHVVGEGSGAAAAAAFLAEYPGLFAGIALDGPSAEASAFGVGSLPAQAYFTHARGLIADPAWRETRRAVPVALWSFVPQSAVQARYWTLANDALGIGNARGTATPANIWDGLFQHLARWTSSPNGDLNRILTQDEVARQFLRRTIRLDDGEHGYLVKLPSSWRRGQRLPVVLSLHGRFEQAWRFLSKIRMHEVGEREGFITVYPEGTGTRWASGDPGGSDARFLAAIPDDLDRAFGIDRTRVYLQGFSNGSAMTQLMGMTRPDLFAAISPNNASVVSLPPAGADLRFARTMMGPAVKAAVDRVKARYDYRMPVFYINGIADSEFAPDGVVAQDAILNVQKDFWKAYNHIGTADLTRTFVPTDGRPSYVEALLSDDIVRGAMEPRWPAGRFVTHRYRTDDPGHADLYAFTVVADLPHAYDFREAAYTWAYFRRFQRMPDGALRISGGR